jgi:uncharacterized membrane protein YoaK (UPF0700 family)
MRFSLPLTLSLNAGYVDTAAFLALKGLFTAHVTGNFVTLGASLVFGTSGTLAKVLALPVFCVTVILARLLAFRLQERARPVLKTLLGLEVLLCLAAAVLGASLGPFENADGWAALLTGMTLVGAMAVQNAAQRLHLPNAPPSTVMTSTTTQIMLDIAGEIHGLAPEAVAASRARLRRMSSSLIVFALGCSAAAVTYAWVDIWCLTVPPAIGSLTLLMHRQLAAADCS